MSKIFIFAKGFTLLEILLVIGIISILLILVVPISLGFYKNQEIETQTQFLIQTLRRAQLEAMSGELDSSFGVSISSQNYTLFKGNSYMSRDARYDEIFDLPKLSSQAVFLKLYFLSLKVSPASLEILF